MVSVLLAMFVAMATAAAQSLTIEVSGDACDLRALDAELATMLANSAVDDAHVSVVTRAGEQWVTAEVLFRDRAGRNRGPRVVTATTCGELFDAITVVIAMAIPEAHRVEERAEEEGPQIPAVPGGSGAPSVPASVAPQLAIGSAAEPTTRTREVVLAGYLAGASGVTSHGVSQQLLLGMRVRRDQRSLTVQLRADAPEEVRVTASGKVDVKRAELSFAPCAHLSAIAGCALATVGVMHGSGVALHSPRDAFTPVVAIGFRLTWDRSLGERFAVRVHVDGQALLTKTTFQVDYMPVWTSSRFEGSAGVGLLARFL